jgi:hypothetical protein
VLLKVQGSTPDWHKGVIEVLYDARANRRSGGVRIDTYVPGRGWRSYTSTPVTFSDGDVLGGRVLDNGQVLIFKNGLQVASYTLNSSDQAFFNGKGGAIGLWFIEAEKAELDNFGGGTR